MFAGNPLLSRAMAVALLVLAIASAWLLLVAPVLEMRESYRAEIGNSERLIGEFEARREDVDGLKRRLALIGSDRSATAAFLSARNPTLAAAKMQSRIKTLTEATGAQLTSTQVVTGDQKKDGFRRVTVRVQMVGSIAAVRDIFHALETSRPFIFIDNTTINVRRAPRRDRRSRQVVTGSSGYLTVSYEASGFLWDRRS